MSQRGLPPSFWTVPQPHLNGGHGSGHHASSNSSTSTATSVTSASYADLYNDQLTHAAQLFGPEWQYLSQSAAAQQGYVNRSAAAAQHHYNYSRFHQPAIGTPSSHWATAASLAATRVKGEWPGAGDYQAAAASAAMSGAAAASLHNPASDFTHPYNSAAAAVVHHYSNMTGKE